MLGTLSICYGRLRQRVPLTSRSTGPLNRVARSRPVKVSITCVQDARQWVLMPAMRICAGGLLVRDRQILFARRSADRSFYPGVWDVIGGHCERDETPADA